MKKISGFFVLATVATVATSFYAVSSFGYGTGYSSYPLSQRMRLLSAEVTGIFSDSGGAGLQARYTHKFSPRFIADAGAGFSGGDRQSRLFVGADYEILPDYLNQPRVSLKGTVERAEEFNQGRTLLSVAPTASKGFIFWGEEAFPFVSIPLSLSLEEDSSTYETVVGASLGITGQVPFEGYQHLFANIETTFDVKDSFNGLFVGLSYPLE